MKVDTFLLFLTGIIILAILSTSQLIYANDNTYRTQISYTKQVCDKSHNEISGSTEQLCGELQDKTNTEYLCNQTGNYCWLEVKGL